LHPCQFSVLRPRTYFEGGSSSWADKEKVVVLKMPNIVKLLESTFSYPFMSFAAELGGMLYSLFWHPVDLFRQYSTT
jgi:hypothetical protein